MNTVILRTIAPTIVLTMLVFSVFVLLRGHNEPGGGFIGGLIAAAGIALHGIASGVAATRRALRVHPIVVAGLGVFTAALSGVLSLGVRSSYLTGLWATLWLGEGQLTVSTPMMFDIGVYLTVFGTISAVALALEGGED